jgi:hypothetical protein
VTLGVFLGWMGWRYGNDLPDHRRLLTATDGAGFCQSEGLRVFTPLAEIPAIVKDAFLAAELRLLQPRCEARAGTA